MADHRENLLYPTTMWQLTPPMAPAAPMPTRFWRISLNLRDVRIYDTIEDADGKERRVLNAKETTLAAQKQQAIREAFKDWIWRDPERRQTLVRQYNEEMNSTRPREYDGSHITFGGMNPAITAAGTPEKRHRPCAVWRKYPAGTRSRRRQNL